MKKILFVIGSLQSGGAERVAARLCSHWSNKGYQITLATGVSEDTDFYEVDEKVKRSTLGFRYNVSGVINKLIEQFIRFFKIKAILKLGDYDVVILSATDISIRFMLNLFFTKKKVIVCEHNNYYAVSSKFKRFVRLSLYLRASFTFVLTERDREEYIKRGFSKDKLIVMPNPLGIPQPEEYIKRSPTKKLLAVGRLTKQKSFERLLNIFSFLDTGYKLTIVGDGEEKNKLLELSNQLGISERVYFAGNQKDIASFYLSHDALLMTSIYEGLPMVIGEADAYSLPVIAYNCPTGPKEMIKDSFNGYLVENGDQYGFIEKVNQLFSCTKIYENLSKGAYANSRSMAIDRIAECWSKYL